MNEKVAPQTQPPLSALPPSRFIVEPATRSDFGPISRLLRDFGSTRMADADWEQMFCGHGWDSPGDSVGHVLRDGAEIVGFIGTIFSRRWINGRLEKLCNLSSFLVKKEFRGHSMRLLMSAVRDRDCTYTDLTLMTLTARLFSLFGFITLEEEVAVVPPLPRLSGRPRLSWPPFQVTTDLRAIPRLLSGDDLALFEAHARARCTHLVLSRGDSVCYVVATPARIRRARVSHVHYISNQEVFWRHLPQVAWGLMRAGKSPLLAIDARQIRRESGPIPVRYTYRLGVPRMYRPAHKEITPSQVDGLYSELMLFKQ